MPKRVIHSNIEVQVHLGAEGIGRTVNGNIQKRGNHNRPEIWPGFVQLLPFECFQVETWAQSTIFSLELRQPTVLEIAEHILRQAKVIPATRVMAQLVIIIHRHWKVLMRVEERRERWMVGKRMIVV